MRRPGRLSRVLLCVCLEFGAMAGIPMRPDQIEDLMRMLSGPKVAQVLPGEDEEGGGQPESEAKSRLRRGRRRTRR